MKYYLTGAMLYLSIIGFSFHLPKKSKVLENIDKNLVVILHETNENDFQEIPTEVIENYIEANELYNKRVKEIFPKLWKASTGEISFMSASQFAKMKPEEVQNSLILLSGFKKFHDQFGEKQELLQFNLFSINKKLKMEKYLDIIFESPVIIDSAQIKFFIQQANQHINAGSEGVKKYSQYINLNETFQIIKNKTLLIDSSLTDLPVEELIHKYTGKIKLVSRTEINQAILNNDHNTLYIRVIYATQKGSAFFYGLFEAETEKIIAVSGFGGFQVKVGAGNPKRVLTRVENNGYITYERVINLNHYTSPRKMYTVYQSNHKLKKVHLNVFNSKGQKLNFRYF